MTIVPPPWISRVAVRVEQKQCNNPLVVQESHARRNTGSSAWLIPSQSLISHLLLLQQHLISTVLNKLLMKMTHMTMKTTSLE
ncbi:hypothetical protein HanRHA438_Chr07g0326631 [Helianthus annuus]|nr:hypothetical protein HanIR_Chr07g0341581 [Helianthus annuus]KAJ0909910.1 hypothetical protein HanRHA438_Chr07g0326631 [Helianthus annuus]